MEHQARRTEGRKYGEEDRKEEGERSYGIRKKKQTCDGVSKSFRTESITKYKLTTINTR